MRACLGRGFAIPIAVALWGILAASAAHADYVTERTSGLRYWEPDYVRLDESIVGLQGRPKGRIRLNSRVIEEVVVDFDRGVVRVTRTYGDVEVSPPWIQDLDTAARLSARKAGWEEVTKILRDNTMRLGAESGGDGSVVIDIPIPLPDAVANVIGEGARLNLTGSERITFSGTSNIIEGVPTFEAGNPSAFPDLDMKQQLRVNLEGTIGRKIHVLVTHDSEVETDLDNRIRLRYDGDEDEIIKKIEMGNTDLVLPGSEFLSFRKSQQGLFGAKVEAQVGKLDLTVIASRQEGETASQTFVGRARRDSVTIRDVDYVKRTYYWVANPDTIAAGGVTRTRRMELYLDDKEITNDNRDGALPGFAYADALTGTSADSTGSHRGFFHRLILNEDYRYDPETGLVIMDRSVPREHVLAAAYTREDNIIVGNDAATDTLQLQILAPPEQELYDDTKGFAEIRDFELKNVYFLGARNISPDSFEMRILRRGSASGVRDEDAQIVEGTEGTDNEQRLEYVTLLGLDSEDTAGEPNPDRIVESQFLDFIEGTITFPNLTPFAPDSSNVNVIVPLSAVSTGRSEGRPFGSPELSGERLLDDNGAIYSLDPDEFLNQNKYYLEVKYTTPTPTYSLNRFNILEGSETVRLNGRVLSRGADYDIDYDFGIITFRTAAASEADAEISVDFEFVPLFGAAKESLVGVSGTYNFSPETRLSSSWLFFTRATPEERPKLGQEPSRILVGNMYGEWRANPSFLTNLVNGIPFVNTESESEIQIQGEAAVSIPNPNTKNEIYIDDMEGTEDSRELSISRGVWSPSSEPAGPSEEDLVRDLIRPLPYNWYNPENVVRRRDVFTELADEREGQDFIQVLEFAVKEEGDDFTTRPDSSGWFGVMRNLSVVGEDFEDKKFLEVWVDDLAPFDAAANGGQGGWTRQGKMIVDLGEISEDFWVRPSPPGIGEGDGHPNGRGVLDTEDFNPRDGELAVLLEDYGLDNIAGDDGAGVAGDDGDDDFEFSRSRDNDFRDFVAINNFEGNNLLDTEDLDDDNFLDDDNDYLSYVFDLADDRLNELVAQENGRDIDGNIIDSENTWRQFRIPLEDGFTVGGGVRLRAVKYARIWFDGLPEGSGPKVRVASIKIVGSSWREERIATLDTFDPVPEGEDAGAFLINVKNNQEDSDYFPPFDPGEINNEERREQSLVMTYDDIPSDGAVGARAAGGGRSGRQGSAFREIIDTGQRRNQDFTQYQSMSFYFRDGAFEENGALKPGFPDGGSQGTLFFRFGPDTTNFYEFSTRPEAGWREVFINLDELTNLKLDPADTTLTIEGVEVEFRSAVTDEGDTLAVYGAPTLSQVERLTLGVRGDDPTLASILGEYWVNEIRLRSVEKDVGYAMRASGNLRLADFASASGGVRRVDSEFRRIEGDRNGSTQYSYNARGDVKLDKFIEGAGISLPVSGDYSYSESTPRLSPNSDIELIDEEDKRLARTTDTRRAVSARFSKPRPSRNWLLRYTVDNLTFGTAFSQNDTRGPFEVRKQESHTGNAAFRVSGQGKTLKIFKSLDFSYLPDVAANMNGALNTTRSSDVETSLTGVRTLRPRTPTRTRRLDGTLGLTWEPLRANSLNTNFAFNVEKNFDLEKGLDLWESVKQGSRELGRDHNSRISYRPDVVRWFRPVFSYDTNYDEDQSPSVQPAERPEGVKLKRVSNGATRGLEATVDIAELFPKRNAVRGGGARARGRASAPRGRGRTPAAAKPAETKDDKKEEKKSEGRGLMILYDGWASLVGMIGDVRYSYSDARSSRFSRVRERPSMAFQFGFEDFDTALIDTTGSGGNLIEDTRSVSFNNRVDASLRPSGDIFLNGGYSRQVSRTASNNTRNKTFAVTWPDVSMTVDRINQVGPLKNWLKSSSVNSSFRKQVSRRGALPDPESNEPDSLRINWFDTESVQEDFSPLISWTANWNSGVNTTFSMARSKTTDNNNNNTNGVLARTITTNNSQRFDARYSFSAPRGINFLGRRLRFNSDLTLSFNFDRSHNLVEEVKFVPGEPPETSIRSEQKTLNIQPRATYNFSRKIQGSLDIGYRRQENVLLQRVDKTITVAVEALIQF